MLIYIEGNIGTGKTTFINNLNRYLSQFSNKVEVVLEPVDEWMETKCADGENILQKFYGNGEKWAFAFQMNSFISRIKKIEDTGKDKLLFVERSIYTDRHCFAKLCYEDGKMTKLEYDVYCKWNDWLSNCFKVQPNAYIYLKCNPNVNSERILQRSREGEEGIPLEYLEALHRKHEEWMENESKSVPVLTIDALENFMDEQVMNKIVDNVKTFIKSL